MLGRLASICLLSVLLGCDGVGPDDAGSSGTERDTESFGRFEGEVVGVWSANGRDMTLREDFVYVDPQNKRWQAPTGSVVNGASIPRAFWSVIGGPFEGRYRNGSVIHDVACVEMAEPWEDVHKMFYEACRCGGVGEKKAKLIYWAVQNFGPRWKTVTRANPNGGETVQVSEPIAPPPPPANVVAMAEEYFETNNPTLEVVESLTMDEIQEAVEEMDHPQEMAPDDDQGGQPDPAGAVEGLGEQTAEASAPDSVPMPDSGVSSEVSEEPVAPEPTDSENR